MLCQVEGKLGKDREEQTERQWQGVGDEESSGKILMEKEALVLFSRSKV